MPAAASALIDSVPSSTATWPVKVLAPVSTRVPGPALVRPLACAKFRIVEVDAVIVALSVSCVPLSTDLT